MNEIFNSTENTLPSFSLRRFEKFALAVLTVSAATGIMFLIGRDTLGEGVIALLYLVPIGWSTARWGQGPGIVAAVVAALSFDFFFIPPFYTFTVGSLEGWLILIIFSVVSVVIVGRIQSGLSLAEKREREAIFMYELSVALADLHTPETIARTLAEKLHQLYMADLVQVTLQQENPHRIIVYSLPPGERRNKKPDRVIPILAPRGLLGEICLWAGVVPLPPQEDRLLLGYAAQGAHALQRISRDQL
jgi:K+-sensing histidine kinase KdpD